LLALFFVLNDLKKKRTIQRNSGDEMDTNQPPPLSGSHPSTHDLKLKIWRSLIPGWAALIFLAMLSLYVMDVIEDRSSVSAYEWPEALLMIAGLFILYGLLRLWRPPLTLLKSAEDLKRRLEAEAVLKEMLSKK